MSLYLYLACTDYFLSRYKETDFAQIKQRNLKRAGILLKFSNLFKIVRTGPQIVTKLDSYEFYYPRPLFSVSLQ
jgi:hypothetical protein